MSHDISVQRHSIKIRKLTVAQKTSLTPEMLRIKFQSDELSDFISSSADDHIKVFFPDPATGELRKPTPPSPGERPAASQSSPMRDYTPQRFDTQKGEIEIDFYLHGKGVGSEWAKKAKTGDALYIGGPRASYVVPYDFDWYLMIGDESSIPSVERRIRELPKNAKALVFFEVTNLENRRDLGEDKERVQVVWTQSEVIIETLKQTSFPQGDFHAWIATESSRAQTLKNLIIQEKGANPDWVKAHGYWKKTDNGSID